MVLIYYINPIYSMVNFAMMLKRVGIKGRRGFFKATPGAIQERKKKNEKRRRERFESDLEKQKLLVNRKKEELSNNIKKIEEAQRLRAQAQEEREREIRLRMEVERDGA